MVKKRRKGGNGKAGFPVPMGQVQQPKRIQFIYKFPDTYNPVYSNGAYGGLSTQGDVVIHFYHERHPIPYSVTNDITDAGAVGAEVSREPKNSVPSVLRFVSTGVVMDVPAARRLHDWLGKQIAASEALLAHRAASVKAKK